MDIYEREFYYNQSIIIIIIIILNPVILLQILFYRSRKNCCIYFQERSMLKNHFFLHLDKFKEGRNFFSTKERREKEMWPNWNESDWKKFHQISWKLPYVAIIIVITVRIRAFCFMHLHVCFSLLFILVKIIIIK